MAKVPLFDAHCSIGRRRMKRPWHFTTVAELIAEMDYHGIEWALVHHATAQEYHPNVGNELLLKELQGQPRLVPCWVLLPPGTEEMPPRVRGPDGQVRETHHRPVAWMMQRGVRAARIAPKAHGWSLIERTAWELFTALAQHRIPTFIDAAQISWSELDAVCTAFPELCIVLTETGYRLNRDLFPALAKHRNIFIEISRYEVHRGMEEICEKFGARRLLFGTGMPEYAPGCPITMLASANISKHDKELIANGNLSRLLKGGRAGG